ncbi:mechanosensitive ion channel protein 10-like [Silene latifolia]|uniref:mechanosensitive ion channel protein 10-like n=1 Tax=Silene latifolia TaxID=37657 RepID=UPI003D76C788
MDSNDKKNHISKEQVVIPIEMNLQSIKIDPKPTNFSSKSPEIFEFSPSVNKPPKYPTPDSPLTRRKSIKSKTRFGEPSVLDSKTLDDLGRTSPKFIEKTFSFKQNTPKSVGNSGRATKLDKNQKKLRPDEKEIYKKITSQLTARNRRRMTIKFSFQLFVFLVILACLLSSLLVKKFEGKLFLDVLVWKWFVFVMATFSGMLLTKWFVNLIVFLIEWKFLLKKNVVYFTHGLKDNVVVFIWFAVVLGTWLGLIKPDVKTDKATKVIRYISMTLITLQVGSFLWLVKTTMMKILASSFHLNRFFDRIQEAVFQHYVLQTLSGSPVVELARRFTKDESCIGQASLANMGDGKEKKAVDWTKIHQMKQEKIPSWTMKLLVDVVSNSGLSTMSGMLNEGVVEGEVDVDDNQITSEEAAIATAVQIFKNVTGDDNACYIKKSDLHRFMIWAEVKVVWPFFEVNENGEIDLKSFCKWVVNVYKDRQALQHALNDNKTAVDELNKMLIAILIILMIILWLLITEIATTKLLVFLSSQLIVAAFIFGNTCKTTFEAIIFVFVMHPFDVSDRCVIDGQMLIVEEMNILNTVFLRPDKEKVFYPNSVLATKAIGNYYRSPDQGDSLEFGIDYRTPLRKIEQLQEQIKLYIEQHPQHWHPSHALIVKEIENVNKIKMVLFFNHTMNFQDYLEKLKRRSVFVLGLKSIFDTLEITYHLLPQEVLLSNIPTMSS